MLDTEIVSVYFLSGYVDEAVLSKVFGIYFFVSILTYSFLQLFSRIKFSFSGFSILFLDLFSSADIYRRFKLCFIFYFISVLSLFVYVGFLGGYGNLWENIGSRQDIFAGNVFFLRLIVLSLQFFGISIFLSLICKSKFFAVCFLFFTISLLFSLGGRLAVFEFLICVLTAYVFIIGNFKIKLSYIFFAFLLVIVSIFVGELRKPSSYDTLKASPTQYISDIGSNFIKSIMPYTVPVQRDIVIIEYFSDRPYWYGSSYISVFYGLFPSALIPNKPPVDTGRYIVAMANGEEINPPVSTKELPNYGWPESFMAGYVNFGIVGVFFVVLMSCLVVTFFYKAVLKRPSVILIMIYSSLMVRGVKYFDPLNTVSLLIFVVVLTFLSVIVSFFRRISISD